MGENSLIARTEAQAHNRPVLEMVVVASAVYYATTTAFAAVGAETGTTVVTKIAALCANSLVSSVAAASTFFLLGLAAMQLLKDIIDLTMGSSLGRLIPIVKRLAIQRHALYCTGRDHAMHCISLCTE